MEIVSPPRKERRPNTEIKRAGGGQSSSMVRKYGDRAQSRLFVVHVDLERRRGRLFDLNQEFEPGSA
jgi:hypothetical protein